MTDVNIQTKVDHFDIADAHAVSWLTQCMLRLEDVMRRDLDVLGALVVLIIVLPLMLILACLIATDGGPVLFSHRRIGRGGVPFGCYKFRTMMVDAESCLPEYLRYHPEVIPEWERHHKLTVDPRVTPLGRLLRRTSLDELPQLFNVLAGHMSLVGPRPVTDQEIQGRYGSYAGTVTSVRPGVTGLWQISGRNDLDYDLRVLLDVEYVESRRLLSDIMILVQTVPAVLRRSGAR